MGGIKCDDRCKEIGNEWRKNDEQRQRSMGLASKRRQELAVEASTLRQQVSDRIQTLETEIQGAEIKFKGLEKELQEVERQEKGKIVKKPKEGGKLGTLVQLAKDRMNELREALSEVRGQRDTARDRVSELENILRTFKEEYNPNFNDEGVKRAVRAWEDYAARDQSDLGNEARDRDLDEICKSEEEGGTIQWAEFEEPEDAEGDIRKWLPSKARVISSTKNSCKSINLRLTFHHPCVNGWTRSSVTYGSSSSKMAFLRVRTTRMQNLRLLKRRAPL